jgi:hypothetical protein
MDDLFQLDRVLTPADRRHLNAKPKTKKSGHAWRPGTGPQGETCKTCEHLVRKQMAKTYLKCGLMRAHWTGGGGTDVRASDPACREWKSITNGERDDG